MLHLHVFLQAGSSIMMCLNEDGKMTAEFGFTEGHAYSKLNDVSIYMYNHTVNCTGWKPNAHHFEEFI